MCLYEKKLARPPGLRYRQASDPPPREEEGNPPTRDNSSPYKRAPTDYVVPVYARTATIQADNKRNIHESISFRAKKFTRYCYHFCVRSELSESS